jgi:predicted nuclease with TOPRIM domain
MAEPLSDFSKILELQEIKRLYEELQEHQSDALQERDEEIGRLKEMLAEARATPESDGNGESVGLREENERLSKQLQHLQKEYESKLERLNSRIRELSGAATARTTAPVDPERKGFFRR